MIEPVRQPKLLPPPADRHLWQIRAVRDLLWILLGAAIFWFAYQVRGIIVPLSLAWALAYLFNPLVGWVERRWRFRRWVTALLLVVAIVAGCAVVVAWLGPLFVRQTIALLSKAPQYLHDIEVASIAEQAQKIADMLRENPANALQSLLAGTGRVFGFLGDVIGVTAHVVVSFTLWLVFFVFFLLRFPHMAERFYAFFPGSRRARLRALLGEVDAAVGGFFRARVLVSLVVGLLFAVGWWMADVPYWFLLGMVAGILNIIPYASTIGWPLAVLLKYLDTTTGNQPAGFTWTAVVLWPSIAYFAVQALDEWVLRLWIGARTTKLNAPTILLALIVGEALAGFYGMLLAIPAAIVLKVVLRHTALARATAARA